MRITKKSRLTGIVALMTAASALVLAVPGTAQAAAWSTSCDKWAANNDPGANDMVATIWRNSDSTKGARASFKGNGETLSARNWAGASMTVRVEWAKGSKLEGIWDYALWTGDSVEMNFDIPEGRTVWVSIGTPGGSTSVCKGKA
ncbi:hypothetical protein PV729_15245 [Streptomyces europaeiscabiei]|uniref:Secreted protein n=1 Tax=Streptomyces europaeiscabiei TaxID=146819 RepID=A0ABU4NCM6_9ACTN|nr:hypothetical protein [Streptomyces europaeiscabiei]MDX2761452.1 hypothetical protein [Streptomyces europaeiscabiei]MDX3543289.1 hypothetical protein [Streptomyces europaeiscabiei]MDX3553105.1 hypothetical protein [Streptomyces europaeiscabiei]MDX3700451.1 hypothetical protein [Streptomyces europaeiscabiei]MDX3843087.1 hypothetical protein [Streptomyces europaeiscabiei]